MICPYCKSEIPDDAKKCMNCGEWMEDAYKASKKESEGFFSFLSETITNLLFWAFILIIAGIVVWAYLDYNGMITW